MERVMEGRKWRVGSKGWREGIEGKGQWQDRRRDQVALRM
jgi:hypothetical protein